MEEKVEKEYIRIQDAVKVFKSKLIEGNIKVGMGNSCSQTLRRDSGLEKRGIFENIDSKTRKILTINRALHPRAMLLG